MGRILSAFHLSSGNDLEHSIPFMSEEHQQSLALTATGIILCLGLSHYLIGWLPVLPGTVDLQTWIGFWNKPIIINWPLALAVHFIGRWVFKKLRSAMTLFSLRQQFKKIKGTDHFLHIGNQEKAIYHPIK